VVLGSETWVRLSHGQTGVASAYNGFGGLGGRGLFSCAWLVAATVVHKAAAMAMVTIALGVAQ
jgi:hypothetical protein